MSERYIIMPQSCNICKKDIRNILLTFDSNYVNTTITWREKYETNEYKYYFPEKKIMTCSKCFKSLTAWDNKKDKFKFLKNREINGKKPRLKFPIYVEADKCVSCKKDTCYEKNKSIHCRDNYISGVGQFCPECYLNTTKDRYTINHMYENYLF